MKSHLSIKEFSQITGIASTTLRYWDEIGLFTPGYRDPQNKYRYYKQEQIITVNYITVLANLNVSLKTIGEVEPARDPHTVLNLIEQQAQSLNRELRRLQECYTVLYTRRELIDSGLKADETKISVVRYPERSIVLGPRNQFEETGAFYDSFMHFCKQAKDLRINLSLPIGGMIDSLAAFQKAPGDPNYFFSLDPNGPQTWEAGDYLVGYHRGFYGKFGTLPERLETYAREHSLTLGNRVFMIYLHDEICVKDPSQYLVQTSIPVLSYSDSKKPQ